MIPAAASRVLLALCVHNFRVSKYHTHASPCREHRTVLSTASSLASRPYLTYRRNQHNQYYTCGCTMLVGGSHSCFLPQRHALPPLSSRTRALSGKETQILRRKAKFFGKRRKLVGRSSSDRLPISALSLSTSCVPLPHAVQRSHVLLFLW